MKYFLILITLMQVNTSFAKSELTIYTSRKEHLVKDLFQKYEAQTKTKINYKTGKAGALIQTLVTEGQSSPADILLTVDAGNLWYASHKNLFEKLKSPTLNKNIPAYLRDKNDQWVGLSVRARTLVYNTNKLKSSELKSYEDLSESKWKGKLCLRTSKKVYNQSLVAMLIHENTYEKAQEIVKGWVNNTVDIFSNDTAVLKAVASGQCQVGIVNTYYFGRLMKKDPKLPLKIFWPNQKNSYGVHINVSGAGILKSSKNKTAALKFLEWLSAQEAQNSFAQINMEYPVNKNVNQDTFVKSWGEFKQNQTFPLFMAGKLQQDAIKLMYAVGYK